MNQDPMIQMYDHCPSTYEIIFSDCIPDLLPIHKHRFIESIHMDFSSTHYIGLIKGYVIKHYIYILLL